MANQGLAIEQNEVVPRRQVIEPPLEIVSEAAPVCRICYCPDDEEPFLSPTPCNCVGWRSTVHKTCLQKWQLTARQNGQWSAGSLCHACNSPYKLDLLDKDDRVPIGIIGGTGLVGRQLAAHLLTHPVFCLGPVVGSGATVGKMLRKVWEEKEAALAKNYGESIWKPLEFPEGLNTVVVQSQEELERSSCRYVVSCIAPRFGKIEDELQAKGFGVFSISPHARTRPENPLIVPEANHEAMIQTLLARQTLENVESARDALPLFKSPNCVTCGLSVALKAIDEAFGLAGVAVTTFQSLSGRGDAKYEPSLVQANVYPLTGTEERTDDYQRSELLRIFPGMKRCSVSAHRVPVQNGHFIDIKIQTRKPIPSAEVAKDVLRQFNPLAQSGCHLPSQPSKPIVVVDAPGRPRPVQDADYEKGMAVAVGNVRVNDGFFDLTCSLVVNNIVRGAWGAALINAELYHLHVRPMIASRKAKEEVRSPTASLEEPCFKKPRTPTPTEEGRPEEGKSSSPFLGSAFGIKSALAVA